MGTIHQITRNNASNGLNAQVLTPDYNFKTLESSTSNDSRLRKIAMMIPKPTAASAAATVITIKTNNCPETSRKKLENATKVRFTALSISSMHINIEITLRLIITPTTPIVNSTADSARYHESCGAIFIADCRSRCHRLEAVSNHHV